MIKVTTIKACKTGSLVIKTAMSETLILVQSVGALPVVLMAPVWQLIVFFLKLLVVVLPEVVEAYSKFRADEEAGGESGPDRSIKTAD